uniref:Uncharacterized protein n=1 Tax=Anguilla anguilla TaxID=7936 RepID=A0A0E9THF8_ANGAN
MCCGLSTVNYYSKQLFSPIQSCVFIALYALGGNTSYRSIFKFCQHVWVEVFQLRIVPRPAVCTVVFF